MSVYMNTIKKMEKQLNVWDAQIKLLEVKTESVGTEFRLKHAIELIQLRTTQYTAAEKLKEMKKATNEAWGQAKETADKLWSELNNGITKVHASIKIK